MCSEFTRDIYDAHLLHACAAAFAGESLEDALRQLYLIDAIDENGLITQIGRKMAGSSLFFLVASYFFLLFIFKVRNIDLDFRQR